MGNISELVFRIVLDAVWSAYSKAMGLVDLLEGIGLDVDQNDKGSPGFHDLYGIQDVAATTILKLWGIDKKKKAERRKDGTQYTVLEEFDRFLYDVYTCYYGGDTFPESSYPELISMLMKLGECNPPWEPRIASGKEVLGAYWDEKRFGPFADRSEHQLFSEGFIKYKADISRNGEVKIWAHDSTEAIAIAKNLTDNEMDAYVTFYEQHAPNVYKVNK